jgi:PAS domain S-box-containing protein
MESSSDTGREVSTSDLAPEALVEAIIEMSDDAIFTFDLVGRISSWSATAERLFGRPSDDVLGVPLEDLFPEHLSDEVQIVISSVVAGERVRQFETELLRPDGMPLAVSLSLCAIVNPQQDSIGAVVIARDVTEQHLAQAALAEIDARMEAGEALAHVGSWLWDLRTGVVQWSFEFHRIHGIDPLDFDGTFESYLGLIHPDDRGPVRAAMMNSVQSGLPFDFEYRVRRPNGQVHLVQVRAQPTLGSDRRAVGLRGIGQDVTESLNGMTSREPDAPLE